MERRTLADSNKLTSNYYPWKAVYGESRAYGLVGGEIMAVYYKRLDPPYQNYMVFSDGKVWSDFRKDFIKPAKINRGYLFVQLWAHNKGKQWLLHRLIATLFVPNPHGYNVVNHIDGNILNNDYTNLEWCTQKYNLFAAQCQGRIRDRLTHPYRFVNKRLKENRLYSSYGTGFMDIFNNEKECHRTRDYARPLLKKNKKVKLPGGWTVSIAHEYDLSPELLTKGIILK